MKFPNQATLAQNKKWHKTLYWMTLGTDKTSLRMMQPVSKRPIFPPVTVNLYPHSLVVQSEVNLKYRVLPKSKVSEVRRQRVNLDQKKPKQPSCSGLQWVCMLQAVQDWDVWAFPGNLPGISKSIHLLCDPLNTCLSFL